MICVVPFLFFRKFMLTQLIYSSRTTQPLTNNDLNEIVASSQRNNAEFGLTGALCYDNGIFLQCVEGERLAIQVLFQYLHVDTRHHEIEIANVGKITQRRFPTWAMVFFSHQHVMDKIFLKNFVMADFNFFSMSPSKADEFFDEVAQHVMLSD